MGMVPGEPNQGLVAEMRGVPCSAARLRRLRVGTARDHPGTSVYRLYLCLVPACHSLCPSRSRARPRPATGSFLNANVDNYGEVYIDGAIDRNIGVITGNNTPKRVALTDSAVPGHAARCRSVGGQRSAGRPRGSYLLPPRYPGLRGSAPLRGCVNRTFPRQGGSLGWGWPLDRSRPHNCPHRRPRRTIPRDP